MACIIVTNVDVQDNPAKFLDPFKFNITFEVIPPGIKDELEWKLIYVGSADDSNCDQELDSVFVGPVSVGRNMFTFEAPAPDPTKIPKHDLLGVTVVLLTCSYKGKEFIRVGYYVNNEYTEELPMLAGSQPGSPTAPKPPAAPSMDAKEDASGDGDVKEGDEVKADDEEEDDGGLEEGEVEKSKVDVSKIVVEKIERQILSDKPRITKFQIQWDQPTPVPTTTAPSTAPPASAGAAAGEGMDMD